MTTGHELAISAGQRVAPLENDPDQLIAGGVIPLEPALSHAARNRRETHTLKSEHPRRTPALDVFTTT